MAQITREKRKNGTISIRVRAQIPNRLKYLKFSQVGLTRYTMDEAEVPRLAKLVEARRRELVAIFDQNPEQFTPAEQIENMLNRMASTHRWGLAKPSGNFAFRWLSDC